MNVQNLVILGDEGLAIWDGGTVKTVEIRHHLVHFADNEPVRFSVGTRIANPIAAGLTRILWSQRSLLVGAIGAVDP